MFRIQTTKTPETCFKKKSEFQGFFFGGEDLKKLRYLFKILKLEHSQKGNYK